MPTPIRLVLTRFVCLLVLTLGVVVSPVANAQASAAETSAAEPSRGVAVDTHGESSEARDNAKLPAAVTEVRAEFDQLKNSILALAPLFEFATNAESWLSTSEAREQLEQMYADAGHPYVRAAIRNLVVMNRVYALDLDGYEELMAGAGYLTHWSFIGPFPNDGMAGMDTAYGPEIDGFDFDASYVGKRQEVSWREIPETFQAGYMPISDYLEPSNAAVAYAVSEFRSARSRQAFLSVAIDGAYKVWMNGELVADVDQHLGGFILRDEIPVRFNSGTNRIAVKLGSGENVLGFHIRIVDAQRSVIVVDDQLPSEANTSWMSGEELADSSGTILISEWLRELLGPNAELSDEERVNAAYIVRRLSGGDRTQPWLSWIDGVNPRDLSEGALRRLMWLQDQHWQREELIDGYVSDDAGPALRFDATKTLAEASGVSGAEELQRGFDIMRTAYPDDARTKILEVMMLQRSGFSETALSKSLELFARYPLAPYAQLLTLGAVVSTSRADLLAAVLTGAVMRKPTNVVLIQRNALALREQGNAHLAESLFDQLEPIHMNDISFLRARAHWARADGELDKAERLINRALALNPTSAELHRTLARVHLSRGSRDAAIAELEAALNYFPQDSDSRRLLRFLQDHEDQFYREWQLDMPEILALKRPADDERLDYRALVDQKITRVYENGLATAYIQHAWQIYSREGADALRAYGIGYTPDSERVEVLGVKVVKEDGTERQLYETRDFDSQSGPAAIYYDVRNRSVYIPTLEAGDVLMLQYTIEDVAYRNIFDDYFGDVWFAGSYAPTAFARYVVLMPSSRPLNTRVANFDGPAVSEEARDSETLYTFEARDLPKIERESYAPGSSELLPYVHVSTYSDWPTLGRWYWNLIEDQLVVSPEIAAMVAELTDGLGDRRAKVAAIHNYVVRNTRYVGLEFGIHGFKPYRTTECFNRRFGDCKDTASLMKVMLEEAGIRANIVLVRTRDLGAVEGRPPSLALFNHAIAYVPEFDLFLDGTAGYSGSSELPEMDQGSTVVIIEDGDGARRTTIPFLPATENLSLASTRLVLDDDGLHGSYEYVAEGTDAPSIRRAFESAENRRESLEGWFSSKIPGATVDEVEVGELNNIEEPASVAFDFNGGQWGVRSGNIWRLPVLGREVTWLSSYIRTSTRELPLVLGVPATSRELFELQLPVGAAIQSMPEPMTLESPWGTFTLVIDDSGSEAVSVDSRAPRIVSVEATLVMNGGRVSVDSYADFRDFALAIQRSLGQSLVMSIQSDL